MMSMIDVECVQDDVHSFACEGCVKGKQVRKPFIMDKETHATSILEFIHSDLCGPMKTMSTGGAMYFLPLIDNFSCKIWVYVFKAKNEVLARFKKWKTLVYRQTEHVVKVLRMDNVGKFVSHAFDGCENTANLVTLHAAIKRGGGINQSNHRGDDMVHDSCQTSRP